MRIKWDGAVEPGKRRRAEVGRAEPVWWGRGRSWPCDGNSLNRRKGPEGGLVRVVVLEGQQS